MARNTRQPNFSEPGSTQKIAVEPLPAGQGRLTQAVLILVLGSALVWVWWRRHMEDLWRQPQHAPLSAQWLDTKWADHAPV